MTRACGSCTMCCRLMAVPEIDKPQQQWCSFCHIGKGCTIYAQRPQSCIDFKCQWLQIETIPDDLRPDRCGVMFSAGTSGDGVIAKCDTRRPTAWRNPRVYSILRGVAKQGHHAMAQAGNRFWAIGTRDDWEVTPDCLTPDSGGGELNIRVPAAIAERIGYRGRGEIKMVMA